RPTYPPIRHVDDADDPVAQKDGDKLAIGAEDNANSARAMEHDLDLIGATDTAILAGDLWRADRELKAESRGIAQDRQLKIRIASNERRRAARRQPCPRLTQRPRAIATFVTLC